MKIQTDELVLKNNDYNYHVSTENIECDNYGNAISYGKIFIKDDYLWYRDSMGTETNLSSSSTLHDDNRCGSPMWSELKVSDSSYDWTKYHNTFGDAPLLDAIVTANSPDEDMRRELEELKSMVTNLGPREGDMRFDMDGDSLMVFTKDGWTKVAAASGLSKEEAEKLKALEIENSLLRKFGKDMLERHCDPKESGDE